MKDFIPKVKSKIKSSVYLDGSKSISNRSLIIAAMAQGQTAFVNLPNSADVLACVGALKELGCQLEHNQESKTLVIQGCSGKFANSNAKIFCNESGTLTRFIIPMLAVQATGQYYVYAKQRMMDRPLADQLIPLEKLGISALYHQKEHAMPLTIKAKSLDGDNIEVDGAKSSQFASGLLMAAPYMAKGLQLDSITDHKQPYLEMTAKVMAEFGINVDINGSVYSVNNSNYVSPDKYVVEPDVSTASYFLGICCYYRLSY